MKRRRIRDKITKIYQKKTKGNNLDNLTWKIMILKREIRVKIVGTVKRLM